MGGGGSNLALLARCELGQVAVIITLPAQLSAIETLGFVL